MERRVRVAAPEGFHQGGGDVVHGVASLVIAHGAALRDLGSVLQSQTKRALYRHRCLAEQFHGVDGFAHITAAGGGNVQGNRLLPCQGQRAAFPLDLQRPQNRRLRLRRRDRLEFKHRAAGQKSAVHIEIGVLRSGGDQRQLAVLHKFQQTLLLLFIEVLDLVQIQQHAARGQERSHIGNDVLDILQRRRGGVEAVQCLLRPLRNDVGNGGLTGAGGTVKDHIGVGAALNQAAKHRTGGQNMALSHHLVQCFRADLIRQGSLHRETSLLLGLIFPVRFHKTEQEADAHHNGRNDKWNQEIRAQEGTH